MLQNTKSAFWRRMPPPFVCVAALTHMAASFFYERLMFSWDYLLDFSRSDRWMIRLTFLCSKLCGALLIFLFWSAVFALVRRRIPKRALVAFALLALPCLYVVAVRWSALYGYEADNALVYYYAIRYLPYAWHHLYTGCLYAGAFMLFPHPAALALVQSMAFCAVCAYLYLRLVRSFGRRAGLLVLWLVLLPESFFVAFNPYRNDFYAILCLWAAGILLLDWVDGVRRGTPFLVGMAAVFSLLAVWRSEGALYAALLLLAFLLVYHCGLRRCAALCGAFLALFLVLKLPQQAAQQTGAVTAKDYSIVNDFNPLQFILNQKTVNLSYPGAQEDLAALEAVTPLPLLKEFGVDGFRLHNTLAGRESHAAGVSSAAYSAFSRSYWRIVLHNPLLFAQCQLNAFFHAIGAPFAFPDEGYSGPASGLSREDFLAQDKTVGDAGNAELLAHLRWRLDDATPSGSLHVALSEQLNALQYDYSHRLAPLSWVRRLAVPVAVCALGVWLSLRRKRWFPALFAAVLLAEWAALIVFSPEGRAAYYYPVMYLMELFLLVSGCALLKKPCAAPPAAKELTLAQEQKNDR